jgi:protein tyrosine phosphatase (PTP) superfamily phosphohydrolase (DUF442 family)
MHEHGNQRMLSTVTWIFDYHRNNVFFCLPRVGSIFMRWILLSVPLLLLGMLGCQRSPAASQSHPGTPASALLMERVEAPGLQNVFKLSSRIYSGSSPEGAAGFTSLQALGIRTVISVDGARPEVELARAAGLRYVHLPVGYDGIPDPRAWQIAKAVRELPGPLYLHCNHGQHRGPAAAAAALLCLDASFKPEQAQEFLRQAGTDPRFGGLFGLPHSLKRPTAAELNTAAGDFPEISAISDLAQRMVQIDQRLDQLMAFQEAGWKTSATSTTDPAQVALLLAEDFREAARLAPSESPQDLRDRLQSAHQHAADLERQLRILQKSPPADLSTTQPQWQKVRADCKQCHGQYRNRPRP